MSFVFVRHGQTDWNVEHRLQGVRDTALNERGREQARALGERWKKEGMTFRKVYSSPLQRALDTAEIATGMDRSGFVLDDRLKEMAFGVMEGAVYSGTGNTDISLCMEAFLGRPADFVPQEGGESFPEVLDRALNFLLDLREKEKETTGNILVVSHGAIMHGLLFHLEGRKDINEFWETPTMNCEPSVWENLDMILRKKR